MAKRARVSDEEVKDNDITTVLQFLSLMAVRWSLELEWQREIVERDLDHVIESLPSTTTHPNHPRHVHQQRQLRDLLPGNSGRIHAMLELDKMQQCHHAQLQNFKVLITKSNNREDRSQSQSQCSSATMLNFKIPKF